MGYEWDMDGITDEERAAKEWSYSEGTAGWDPPYGG